MDETVCHGRQPHKFKDQFIRKLKKVCIIYQLNEMQNIQFIFYDVQIMYKKMTCILFVTRSLRFNQVCVSWIWPTQCWFEKPKVISSPDQYLLAFWSTSNMGIKVLVSKVISCNQERKEEMRCGVILFIITIVCLSFVY